MSVWLALQLSLLVVAANSAPVLAQDFLGSRWQQPVDAGRRWRDQRPLLGAAKTWRGLVAALLLSTGVAGLLGLGCLFGLCFGALAMLGDLITSFIKRRLGLESSSRAIGLDQLPESFLPLLLGSFWLQFPVLYALLLALLFMLASLIVSPLLYRWGWRKRPY